MASVWHRYGRSPWVLEALDATLAFGAVVAVQGANGTGKSTLLRVLVGVQHATRGRVSGRPPRLAYVPERMEPPAVRVHRWLAEMARLRGSASDRVAAALDELSAVAPPSALVTSLSKGTVRKVLLADALAASSALVVVADHTGAGRALADREIVLGDPARIAAVEVRYRADVDRVTDLDAAAAELGFRRADP